MFQAQHNAFDDVVAKATDENLTSENWKYIMDVVDKVTTEENSGKDVVASMTKRLAHRNANVQLYTLELANALSQNCGLKVHRELASRAFTDALLRLANDRNTQLTVNAKILERIEWAQMFSKDPDLGIMNDQYHKLGNQNPNLHPPSALRKSRLTDLDRKKEGEELQMAFELSIQDKGAQAQAKPSQPAADSASQPAQATQPQSVPSGTSAATVSRVRALYDFQPSEPGELMFKKGDIIAVLESVYKDWWKGSLRGQTGIFPLNYVEKLSDPTPEELQREAQMEAEVFAEIKNVEKLLTLLSASNSELKSEDSDEITKLYHSTLAIRPKLIELIGKYSKKKVMPLSTSAANMNGDEPVNEPPVHGMDNSVQADKLSAFGISSEDDSANRKSTIDPGSSGTQDFVKEQQGLLDLIDKLQYAQLDNVKLPQIVVVGAQSAGKSSVLKALTGIPFPRESRACSTLERVRKDVQASAMHPPLDDQFFPPQVKEGRKKYTKIKRGLSGFVNETRVSAIADTGSAQNVISAAYASDMKLPIQYTSSSFQLGNSKTIRSIGTVRLPWAFAEDPKKKYDVLFHVLPTCIYDVILGSAFLTATETLSKYGRRLTECVFSVARVFKFGFLGNTCHRLEGVLDNKYPILAVPDTGAERNVMDAWYAKSHGFHINTGPGTQNVLQFADGSYQETIGQVTTNWTFTSGKEALLTFEVLEDCASEVVIGEEFIFEHNIFKEHESSLRILPSNIDSYELAPFDFISSWQQKYLNMKSKFRNQDAAVSTDFRNERVRRDIWNHKYEFGRTATTEEMQAETKRRENYKNKKQEYFERNTSRALRIPSISTSSSGGLRSNRTITAEDPRFSRSYAS